MPKTTSNPANVGIKAVDCAVYIVTQLALLHFVLWIEARIGLWRRFMGPTDRAHEAARSIVLAMVPAEEFSFEGVWEDVSSNPEADLNQAIEIEGGSKLVLGGVEVPLLSAIIIPVALWVANKVADRAAKIVLDEVEARVRDALTKNRSYEGGRLSDAEILRIARVLTQEISSRK